MPKRTDAEWETLGDRLARDVMGWSKWHELTEEEQGMVMVVKLRYHNHGAYWWQRDDETYKVPVMHVRAPILGWYPHKDRSQAMQVLDEMSSRRKGAMHNWFYRIQSYPQVTGHLYNVFLHTCIYPRHSQAPLVLEYSADAYILTHAICLAIEQVMDAQKEARGAQED